VSQELVPGANASVSFPNLNQGRKEHQACTN
jgi:hypothetical protein